MGFADEKATLWNRDSFLPLTVQLGYLHFVVLYSIAVGRELLFTNNSFIVFDGKVAGFRLATHVHLDAVTLPFLYKKTAQILDFETLFSFQYSLFNLQWSLAFSLISSTVGGWSLKGNVHPKWNGCSLIDGLSLGKGGLVALFCSVISSMASYVFMFIYLFIYLFICPLFYFVADCFSIPQLPGWIKMYVCILV